MVWHGHIPSPIWEGIRCGCIILAFKVLLIMAQTCECPLKDTSSCSWVNNHLSISSFGLGRCAYSCPNAGFSWGRSPGPRPHRAGQNRGHAHSLSPVGGWAAVLAGSGPVQGLPARAVPRRPLEPACQCWAQPVWRWRGRPGSRGAGQHCACLETNSGAPLGGQGQLARTAGCCRAAGPAAVLRYVPARAADSSAPGERCAVLQGSAHKGCCESAARERQFGAGPCFPPAVQSAVALAAAATAAALDTAAHPAFVAQRQVYRALVAERHLHIDPGQGSTEIGGLVRAWVSMWVQVQYWSHALQRSKPLEGGLPPCRACADPAAFAGAAAAPQDPSSSALHDASSLVLAPHFAPSALPMVSAEGHAV